MLGLMMWQEHTGAKQAAVAVEAGTWYHVAAVKQGGELKLYLDGRARGTTLNVASLFS